MFTLPLKADIIEYKAPSEATEASVSATSTKDDTYTVSEINKLIEHYASKYGVSARVMKNVIQCESQYDHEVQSRHTYESGAQERSYGLVQIHLPSHPQVSKEEARDPEYAIKFMAQHFAVNNHNLWTCYRRIYGS